jgi:hypothetical protein
LCPSEGHRPWKRPNALPADGWRAAIAVENATLFENLQDSNRELSQAYDATIEGWSRALDLRDKETEGHTLRVTALTLNLARSFGFNEEELRYIRWPRMTLSTAFPIGPILSNIKRLMSVFIRIRDEYADQCAVYRR